MNIDDIVSGLTLTEKAELCSGLDFWNTKPAARMGVPAVMMTDGPYGLRKELEGYDSMGIGQSIKAVCFPASCALASSFDFGLAQRVGKALGDECQAEKIGLLLGPGLNIKRSPLCGRNFEYYSEDPYLAGEFGAAAVRGIQSAGAGACVKHFAANNQETRRMSGDSVVDERTLHEIYLSAFEKAVKEGKPRAVMCAYNRLNGTYCAENGELLTDILRKRWGFDGMVVTDWGAAKDTVNGIKAGLDLIMPGGSDSYTKKIVAAVENGELGLSELDATVKRILEFVDRAVSGQRKGVVFDRDRDYELAEKAAEECAVLLKNDRGVLPLRKDAKVAFIGEFAARPRYQGSGSSHINSAKVVSALEAAKGYGVVYAQGYDAASGKTDRSLLAEAVKAAGSADAAVLFVGLPDAYETEGVDRAGLDMPDNQNELIKAVAAVQPNTAVVLHNGAPVVMPWIDGVPAVLEMYLAGDGCGQAAAALLFGDANPSGKLAETFPLRIEDTPAYLNFPGEHGIVEYREGVFVGYRYYDKRDMPVLFPFGHGLSYTGFEYGGLRVDKPELTEKDTLAVSLTVKNTGSRFGKEAVQLYIGRRPQAAGRPVRELRGVSKVALEPGQSKEVSFTLDTRAFSYYDTRVHDFAAESGTYVIEAGSSSRDLRLCAEVKMNAAPVPVKYDRCSTVGEIMSSPKGRAALGALIAGQKGSGGDELGAGTAEMRERMMEEMPLSALVHFAGLSDEAVDAIIESVNS